MAQATDLVVLISSSEGIIVKGMERKLQDAGVNVEHCMPVVNLVKKYDVRVFPTKLLLDREGKILFRLSGEHQSFFKKVSEILKKE